MQGFNFEKNLNHQSQAVESTLAVFEHLPIHKPAGIDRNCFNPVIDFQSGNQYARNILELQNLNGIDQPIRRDSHIIDIMMETGTGKTYTYAKTIFELNKHYGIFKFVVVVPTLSIKAGTVDFLKSESSREHFKEQYGKSIQLHIVESKKGTKAKKSFIPPAVSSFVTAGDFQKNNIQVLLINAGMINSDIMQKTFDKGLFDQYLVPFDGISAVKPFMIIDEPHKFAQANKTWKNIQRMKPQFIIRYGATFQDYENLIYTLSAVDAFNRNLVKGVVGHITEFEEGKNAMVKLTNTDGTEASFELTVGNQKKTVKLTKKDSLQLVHPEMTDLLIENLNKTKVVLSNGMEIKKGDKINPYSYAQKLQEIMIQKAVRHHFELERELLTREVKIKPLTLFFIDNIEEYRSDDGYIKSTIEQLLKAEIKELLKKEKDGFYKAYLEKALLDVSKTHAGYFSQDNTEKDEAIEQEVNEILHDKQAMLDLDNPRRFIFSKWTLREGWDNPNVFQICKLRSSGSEISKLQEVGRGLRLPVNEYGNRVKDEQFYLNYFVDFTESDFVDKLVNEINEKSGALVIDDKLEKLTDDIIKKICEVHGITEEALLFDLDTQNAITRTNEFREGGLAYFREKYPVATGGLGIGKIRKSTDTKKHVTVRAEKYQELKDLWEKLNEKVILEYKFENETHFQKLLTNFFKELQPQFTIEGIRERKSKIEIRDKQAISSDEYSALNDVLTPISTIKYSNFLLELSKSLKINLKTIHQAILISKIDINQYLNTTTIRIIRQEFDGFLMYNAIDKFSIEYKKVSNQIHPTKLTDEKGIALGNIQSADIGVIYDKAKVSDSYFFNELFYDSELEKENIEANLTEVVIFTKIPKSSIKIPVAGGKSYSPDFAYVLNFKDGDKKLHFIVETKNVKGEEELRKEELQKIKHAEQFFSGDVKIKFRTQFSNKKIGALIKELALNNTNN